MRNTYNKTLAILASCALLVSSALFVAAPLTAQGQTAPQITGVVVTPEKAIQLYWTSTKGETYQIQYAGALGGNDDGSTAWQTLYDNYPAHGTNTFIGDFGNYNESPWIHHPKYGKARFYRILDKGPDSLTNAATVTIDVLTNNAAVTGEIIFTVTASSDQPGLYGTTLYVDGQEMQPPDDSTNYTVGATNYVTDTYYLNTCEWLNGTHVLFATTEAASQYTAWLNSGPVLTGHAVSPKVSLLFSNLVQGISFSQPLFDPAQGQTQQVSAVFAANCDWTLNILDVNSNTVQTASGSGTSLLYKWDGTSNGANLPNGLYLYSINAVTNGKAAGAVPGGGVGGSGGIALPVPGLAKVSSVNAEDTALWAMPAEGGGAVPLALYPPSLDTSGLTIFSATPAQVSPAKLSVATAANVPLSAQGSSSGISPKADTPPAQPAPPAPQRPPNNPVKGLAGTFGVAADTYGPNGVVLAPLKNGMPFIPAIIPMDDRSITTNIPFGPLKQRKAEADTFVKTMQSYGWSNSFKKIDDELDINDLRGSGTPFNNVNLGVLMLHGTYGNGNNAIDYYPGANGCKQMYFPVTSGGNAQYLRFSEMNLGGSGTNGLKWMVIDACRSLYQANWQNMQNLGVHPYNSNLHMILGAQTVIYTNPLKWKLFAKYMNYGKGMFIFFHSAPYTIHDAYFQANIDALKNAKGLDRNIPIIVSVVSDPACVEDSVLTNSPPEGGDWQWSYQPVYPLP